MADAGRLTGIRPAILVFAGVLLAAPVALVVARWPEPPAEVLDPAIGPAATAGPSRVPGTIRTARPSAPTREIAGADLQALAEQVRTGSAHVSVVPNLLREGGFEVQIDSVFGAGVLTRAGLAITDPGVGAPLGFRAGDHVTAVNGQDLLTAGGSPPWRLPRTHRDPARGLVDVTIDRSGTTVTETFRIR